MRDTTKKRHQEVKERFDEVLKEIKDGDLFARMNVAVHKVAKEYHYAPSHVKNILRGYTERNQEDAK